MNKPNANTDATDRCHAAGGSGFGPILPDVLRIKSDGTLFCADGRDLKEYMAAFAPQG